VREKKKLKRNLPALFLFLIFLQIFAVFLTYNFIALRIEVPQYEPFGNVTIEQAGLNALLLLAPVIVFTLILVTILKVFGISFFRFITMFLSIAMILFVNPIYVFALLANYFPLPSASILSYSLTFVLIAFVIYSFIRYNLWIANTATFIISAEIGSLFALMLSPPTLFIIPLAFLLYDAYAVFFGPLKTFVKELKKGEKPIKTEKSKTRGLNLGIFIANVGGFSIGSGDLFFYSLLVSAAFILGKIFATFIAMLAINFGILMNLLLLMKYKRALPGLPIPLTLGLLTLLFFWYF
jgi:presenilin-like A22 family membrane protease